MNFEQKRVLITGGAGGIGHAIVKKFKALGALIAVADLECSDVRADAVFEGDLNHADFCTTLPSQVVNTLGGLDIIVNNAGVMRRGAVTESSDEDFALSMAVNVRAPFQISRSAIPIMERNGGGAIVNMASCWGVHPGPNHALYCMTKAALASLTQCMGRDHAHQGIRVNAVCPNEVDTPMLRSGFSTRGLNASTAIDELNKTVPLGRIATPDDIADVVLFLASDAARYLCGSLVEVNGGKAVS